MWVGTKRQLQAGQGMAMANMQRAATGLAVVTVCAAVALVAAAIVQGNAATSLLSRDEGLRQAMGMPSAKWGGAHNQESLTDNFGANNMKISKIIDDLNSVQSHPNFAAAIHSLTSATHRSTEDFSTFTSELHPIESEKFLPSMPNPEAVVQRMQGLRKTSRYCRLNPGACKTLAPEWVAERKAQPEVTAEAEAQADKEAAEGGSAAEAAEHTAGSTFAGRGDSLLPHGPLWGLRDKNAVRYHEYPGWYDGSQADRAASESPKQAASEAYGLESKELADAWRNMGKGLKRIRSKVSSARFASDYKEGGALLKLGGSKVGALLPHLAKLESAGKRKALSAAAERRALPAMGGVSMSVVKEEQPELALEEEEQYEGRQQQMLAQWASQLPRAA